MLSDLKAKEEEVFRVSLTTKTYPMKGILPRMLIFTLHNPLHLTNQCDFESNNINVSNDSEEILPRNDDDNDNDMTISIPTVQNLTNANGRQNRSM